MSNIVTKFTSLVVLLAVGLVPALAQYPTGGGDGMGSGSSATPGYTPPQGGYSSKGKIIGIGAGAAAGAGLAFWALHRRPSMVGCVQRSGREEAILNEKDGKLYRLQPESEVSLKPGERVALKGEKIETSSGQELFHATKLIKDYGRCEANTVASAR